MKAAALILVVMLLCGIAVAEEQRGFTFESGTEFLAKCSTIPDDRKSTYDSLACVMWLKGFVDGAAAAGAYHLAQSGSSLKADICYPDGNTLLQNTKVIVKYMNDNPSTLHQPTSVLAFKALKEAFPCKP
ncbi:MAG TPA: Rap1a/Tai family immunity protein [Terriglobales bacterium]|nr:Rap1a/Tai family immunity protein [Terriglobales bacterium]